MQLEGVCEICGLASTQVYESRVVLNEASERVSLNHCLFCWRCKSLECLTEKQGSLMLAPEWTQIELQKTVLSALALDLWAHESRLGIVPSVRRVVSAARRFLRLTVSAAAHRWQSTQTQITVSDSVGIYLKALSVQPDIKRSQGNAVQSLRYLPVLDDVAERVLCAMMPSLWPDASVCAAWETAFTQMGQRFWVPSS